MKAHSKSVSSHYPQGKNDSVWCRCFIYMIVNWVHPDLLILLQVKKTQFVMHCKIEHAQRPRCSLVHSDVRALARAFWFSERQHARTINNYCHYWAGLRAGTAIVVESGNQFKCVEVQPRQQWHEERAGISRALRGQAGSLSSRKGRLSARDCPWQRKCTHKSSKSQRAVRVSATFTTQPSRCRAFASICKTIISVCLTTQSGYQANLARRLLSLMVTVKEDISCRLTALRRF